MTRTQATSFSGSAATRRGSSRSGRAWSTSALPPAAPTTPSASTSRSIGRRGSGLHLVPVEVAYTAVDGTRPQWVETLGIDLRGRGELAIASLKTDPVRVRQGDEVDLIVRMDNTGTGDARAVSARVDVPLPGTKEAFVGTVRPGSNAPAVFALTADRAGEFDYTFNATYEDDWGSHAVTRTLRLSVASSGSELTIGVLLLAVIVGAAVFFIWWRRKGRTSHV